MRCRYTRVPRDRSTARAAGVVGIDWLVHYVPRVDAAGVVFHHAADVVRHDLLCIRRCYVGLKPVRQGIPPNQAMATEEHAMLFGPGNSIVAIRKIVDVGGGPQILGELQIIAVGDHGEGVGNNGRSLGLKQQFVLYREQTQIFPLCCAARLRAEVSGSCPGEVSDPARTFGADIPQRRRTERNACLSSTFRRIGTALHFCRIGMKPLLGKALVHRRR